MIQHYEYGVISYDGDFACQTEVISVGYGSDVNGPYVITRFSFGTSWGENGYMRVRIIYGANGQQDAMGLCQFYLLPAASTPLPPLH